MKVVDTDGTELTSDSWENYRKEWEEKHPFLVWFDNLFKPHSFGIYAPHVIFTKPIMVLSQITDQILWAWQRVFRGWDDRVLWGIDYYLAKMIPIWVAELKHDCCGIPSQIFEEGDITKNGHISNHTISVRKMEYYAILDRIISGFAGYEQMMEYGNSEKLQEKLELDFKTGFELFKDWFSTLGD